MRAFFVWTVMCVGAAAWCAEPPLVPAPEPAAKPAFRFPTVTVPPVTPDSPTVPVTVLTPGTVFVIEADFEPFFRVVPAKAAKVTKTPGPLTVSAVFAGGTGKRERRTFTSKYVLEVEAGDVSALTVTLVLVPSGVTDDKSIATQVLTLTPAGPVAPPVVPPALDPLFDAVQGAYGADQSPTKAADKASLAAVYRSVAAQVKDPVIQTVGDLAKIIADARSARVGTSLSAERGVFGAEFAKAVPADATVTLNDATRTAAATLLTRFATVLEALK